MPDAESRPSRTRQGVQVRALARTLSLALLLTAAACAGAPGEAAQTLAPTPMGKPGAALRHAADIPGPACASEHRLVIEEALGLARQRMAEAIRLVREQPEHGHLRRWFGTTPPPEIQERLRLTAVWLDQPERFKLLCNDPPACRGARMAYAAPSRRIVGLCPAFFRASATGFDTSWGVLIHEASHLGAGTDDHAYGPQAALILAKADPQRAARNADNYEYFVETLPR
ncbi:M35 family metallopeptidase [Falsiroseomonas sp.]|uniref:M35 family metallopeptidase n=1 Tax=Falsiroseomonas sp. TaxID=2870721 RepID=UPI00356A1AA3